MAPYISWNFTLPGKDPAFQTRRVGSDDDFETLIPLYEVAALLYFQMFRRFARGDTTI